MQTPFVLCDWSDSTGSPFVRLFIGFVRKGPFVNDRAYGEGYRDINVLKLNASPFLLSSLRSAKTYAVVVLAPVPGIKLGTGGPPKSGTEHHRDCYPIP